MVCGILGILVLAAIVLWISTRIVPYKHIMVVDNLGKVYTLAAGVHVVWPWAKCVDIPLGENHDSIHFRIRTTDNLYIDGKVKYIYTVEEESALLYTHKYSDCKTITELESRIHRLVVRRGQGKPLSDVTSASLVPDDRALRTAGNDLGIRIVELVVEF